MKPQLLEQNFWYEFKEIRGHNESTWSDIKNFKDIWV